MSKLPKNWRAVLQDGHLLYLQRNCGRYCVRPELSDWYAYFDADGAAPITGKCIGKHQTYEGAMLICREHMYQQQKQEVA